MCVFRSEVGVLQAENIWDLIFICLPTVWFLIDTFSAFNFKVIIVKYASITILKIILGLPFVVLICSFLLLISSLEIWWQYLALCLDSSIVCVCACVYLLSVFGLWLPWSFYIAIYDYFKMMSSSLQMHCDNLPFLLLILNFLPHIL